MWLTSYWGDYDNQRIILHRPAPKPFQMQQHVWLGTKKAYPRPGRRLGRSAFLGRIAFDECCSETQTASGKYALGQYRGCQVFTMTDSHWICRCGDLQLVDVIGVSPGPRRHRFPDHRCGQRILTAGKKEFIFPSDRCGKKHYVLHLVPTPMRELSHWLRVSERCTDFISVTCTDPYAVLCHAAGREYEVVISRKRSVAPDYWGSGRSQAK